MKKSNTDTKKDKASYVWASIRILLGLIFIWAFADKMIGLGYSTCRNIDPVTKVESVQTLCIKSVAKGASPTAGFLKFGTKGPMKNFYSSIAGNKIVDFLFMAGLLFIGLSLLTGVGIKIATISGALLLIMMWSAVLPPANHPFLDDHIIYALALVGINVSNGSQVWGLGKWWKKQTIVKNYTILE